MPSQMDYANLVYALSTLAKAPVAQYPESGAFQLAEQAQDVARAKLAEEARKEAIKKAKKKERKGNIIKGVSTAAGAVIGGPLVGAGGMAGAGMGATLGGAAGDVLSGGSFDPASVAGAFEVNKEASEKSLGYGEATKRRYKRKSVEDVYGGGFV